MSPLQHSNNLAARMGRWSASHWKTAVFGWLAFVVAAVAIGQAVGQKTVKQQDANVGQAHRADTILAQAGFGQSDPQTEIVLIQSKHLTIGDAAFRSTVHDVVGAVSPSKAIKNLRSPLDAAHGDLVSKDGHSALVEWDMKGTEAAAEKRIDALTKATAAVAKAHPGLYVGEAGSVSSNKALNAMFNKQLAQAGERSIPLTLIVLLLVFGTLVAAWIPLLLALTSVIATTGLVAVASHAIPMDGNVSAVVLLVGLAVGVDYTLFYLKREREERAAGRGHRAALEAAAATSGRSVLISGLTVMVAMAGMFFTRDKTFMSFSVATMLVVGVAMIGSLTVLPAILSKLGDRVEKGRIPFLGRLRRQSGENRFWAKVLTPALKHPVVAALASTAVLVALAVPVLSLHTAQSGLDSLPRNLPTVETIDRLRQGRSPEAPPRRSSQSRRRPAHRRSPPQSRAEEQVASDPRGARADQRRRQLVDGTAARVAIPLDGNGVDDVSTRALLRLRNDVLPSTIGRRARR